MAKGGKVEVRGEQSGGRPIVHIAFQEKWWLLDLVPPPSFMGGGGSKYI